MGQFDLDRELDGDELTTLFLMSENALINGVPLQLEGNLLALANRLIGNGAGNAFHTSYTDMKSLVRKVLYKEGTVKEDHFDVLIVEKYYMKKDLSGEHTYGRTFTHYLLNCL